MYEQIASIQKNLLADAAEAALRLNTEPDLLVQVLSKSRAPLPAADEGTIESLLYLKERLQRAADEMGENRHAILALRASWSWRLTAPLRALLDVSRAVVLLLRPDGRGVWQRRRMSGAAQWIIYRRQVRVSGLFDQSYYRSTHSKRSPLRMNALLHFFVFGAEEGRSPNCLFDTRYYRQSNPDVAQSLINPLVHYLKWGAYEDRNPHPQFDSSYYLENNPDVRQAHLNPLAHFLAPGIIEGRNPNQWFNTFEYLERNPDAAALGLNPLVHHMERKLDVLGRDSDLQSR